MCDELNPVAAEFQNEARVILTDHLEDERIAWLLEWATDFIDSEAHTCDSRLRNFNQHFARSKANDLHDFLHYLADMMTALQLPEEEVRDFFRDRQQAELERIQMAALRRDV